MSGRQRVDTQGTMANSSWQISVVVLINLTIQFIQKLSVFRHAVQNIDHIATVYMIPFVSWESTRTTSKARVGVFSTRVVFSCIEKSAQHASCDPFRDFLLNRGSTTAYQAIAYEYAIEMTPPLPEGTAATLLMVWCQGYPMV